MTRLALLADLHGNFHLPPPRESDLFLFAGDFFAREHSDYKKELLRQYHELPLLLDWLHQIPAERIFFIGGNHDYLFHTLGRDTSNWIMNKEGIPATYLENSGASYGGISLWGTPYVASSTDGVYPRSSAFVLSEESYKQQVSLPEVDIILSHSSPWYDFTQKEETLVDSENAARHLRQEVLRQEPRLIVSGHFHWMRGKRQIGQTESFVPSAVLPYLPNSADYEVVPEDPYMYYSL